MLIPLGLAISYIYQEEQKQNLKRTERFYPERYLRVDNTNTKLNLLLDNVVRGTITNNAQRTTYGEIILELTWYDRRDQLLSKSNYTVNKNVSPFGGSISFKVRDQAPFRAKKYNVRVTDATTTNQY